MIKITDKARAYLIGKLNSRIEKYVYLKVKGGGCSGFKYEWSFTDDESLGEVIEQILVLDKISEMFVIGSTLDYIDDIGSSQLKFVNPNASASCGCGESFAYAR